MGIGAPVVPLGSTVATTSGVGPALDLGSERATLRMTLSASAASGTLPTLDVSIETSPDVGAAQWLTKGSFAQLIAAGAKDLEIQGVQQFIRARWKIAGDTPSFTFAIAGRAVTAYTNRALIVVFGINEEAIAEVTDEDVALCASAASREFDRYIWLKDTPLRESEVTGDVMQDASILAQYRLMTVRGFDPSKADSKNILIAYRDCVARLQALNGGRKLPPFDTGPATTDTVQIATSPRRGWGQRGSFAGRR